MLNGIINSMNMSLNKLQKTVEDGKAWYAAIHAVAVRHDLVTEQQLILLNKMVFQRLL